jgi:hypothetical protein
VHSICITGFSAAARFVSVGTPTCSAHRPYETTTSTSHLLRNDDGDIQDRHQAAARDEGLGEGEGREEGGGGWGSPGSKEPNTTAAQQNSQTPPVRQPMLHPQAFPPSPTPPSLWNGREWTRAQCRPVLSSPGFQHLDEEGWGGGAHPVGEKEGQSAAPPHIFPGHTPTSLRSPSATREAAYQPPRPRTEAAAPARAHARHARTQQAAHFIWAPPSTPSRNEWRRTRARSG